MALEDRKLVDTNAKVSAKTDKNVQTKSQDANKAAGKKCEQSKQSTAKSSSKENNQRLLTDFLKSNSAATTSSNIIKKQDTAAKVCKAIIDIGKEGLNEKGVSCNLDDELDLEQDELIIKSLHLSKELLSLKETDCELFWEKVAELVRIELNETLEDNKQVFFSNILIQISLEKMQQRIKCFVKVE